jgi:CubicO group peptidase (beta-lactamase class C family)
MVRRNNLKSFVINVLGHYRKVLSIAGVIVAVSCIYHWFEPLLVWTSGWSELPTSTAVISGQVHSSNYQAEIDQARKILLEAHSELEAPAVSVAVGIKGKLIWSEAIGFADLDDLTPVTTDSQFRIGSTSKALTSVAMGRLIDMGKIDIDKTIDQYIDYFDQGKRISTRQLLSHTAGIRDYQWCLCFPVWEYYNTTNFDSVEDAVNMFSNSPLLFEPGSRYKYSSYGYTLLSGVMEVAAEQDFLSLMKNELFAPLKMNSTMADKLDKKTPERVGFYDIEDGRYKAVFEVDNSNKWAGGGFLSTPSDLVRLGNALLTQNFVTQDTLNSLFAPQRLNNGDVNPENYALGWRSHETDQLTIGVAGEEKKLHIVHHGGVAVGSLSFFMLVPEKEIVISIVANRSLQGKFPMAEYAISIVKPFI